MRMNGHVEQNGEDSDKNDVGLHIRLGIVVVYSSIVFSSSIVV